MDMENYRTMAATILDKVEGLLKEHKIVIPETENLYCDMEVEISHYLKEELKKMQFGTTDKTDKKGIAIDKFDNLVDHLMDVEKVPYTDLLFILQNEIDSRFAVTNGEDCTGIGDTDSSK